jgi:hypothetical protein
MPALTVQTIVRAPRQAISLIASNSRLITDPEKAARSMMDHGWVGEVSQGIAAPALAMKAANCRIRCINASAKRAGPQS